MRCHHCLRLATEPICPLCGSEAAAPVTRAASSLDFEPAFLLALESPDTACDDDLWDLFCLSLRFKPVDARVDARVAEIALADLSPQKHCLLGLYMVLRLRDADQAAAHFATALEAGGERIAVGPAVFTCTSVAEGEVDLELGVGELSEPLGRLDREAIRWVTCDIKQSPLLAPIGWHDWSTRLSHLSIAAEAMWKAVCTRDGQAKQGDTGFRSHWKDFQHALGEQRDRLEPPAEQLDLQASLQGRNKQALRQLDVPRCVSALVESSRNTLRIHADALRSDRAHEASLQAREAFTHAFLEGSLEDVVELREELRRETTTAHAELRKALDYQGRLLRSAQEALNASLAEIARRASSLLWPLTPQHLFDEAREQTDLVVERAREVAMIEQTDAYLQNLSPSIESAGNEITGELSARRGHLEAWRRGLQRQVGDLGLETTGELVEPARALRERFRDMPCRIEALPPLLEQLQVRDRAREAALT